MATRAVVIGVITGSTRGHAATAIESLAAIGIVETIVGQEANMRIETGAMGVIE